MYCKKCGTDNPDGAVYCRNCGYELTQARRNAGSAPASSSPLRGGGLDRNERLSPAPAPSYGGRDTRAAASSYSRDAAPTDKYKPLSTWAYYGLSLLYGLSIIAIFTITTLVVIYIAGGAASAAGAGGEFSAFMDVFGGSMAVLWIISIVGLAGFVMMILFSCGIVKNVALMKFSRGYLLKWGTVLILIIVWIILTAVGVFNAASRASTTYRW